MHVSRELILEQIGQPPDLTFVRGAGNWGDELIWAGTRALLSDHIYREIDLAGLTSAEGHTVVLTGGGAFCRPYHELMPRMLSIAGLRFERVIVLPSSFDPSVDEVRDALSRTRATVFAREPASHRRIVSLCDARLAHDCAFFYDFAPLRREGQGTLNAFRSDREAGAARATPPPDNDDISVTATSLRAWLEAIASHELIRTDRAHVMIAAALLGKRVQYASSSYHKVPAIARYALAELPVEPIPEPPAAPAPPARPPRRLAPDAPPRVSAIVLTRGEPAQALRAIDSIASAAAPTEILVLDNNCAPDDARALAARCAERDRVRLRRSDRNLGCAGGRQLALADARGQYVLLVDDDMELDPGALDLLVEDLDRNPGAAAASATVAFLDGTVHHSGGWMGVAGGSADFELIGFGGAPDDVPPSGAAGWAPSGAALIRREVLERFPMDAGMRAYFEDNEWCYRVSLALPGCFRRSREARATHRFTYKYRGEQDIASRSLAVELLAAQARFYARHGLVLGFTLVHMLPSLANAHGTCDVPRARLLMELILARGTDWTLMQWFNGGLDAVLHNDGARLRDTRTELAGEIARRDDSLAIQSHQLSEQSRQIEDLRAALAGDRAARAEQERLLAFLHERNATLHRIELGGWWQLRGRVEPALRAASWARRRVRS